MNRSRRAIPSELVYIGLLQWRGTLGGVAAIARARGSRRKRSRHPRAHARARLNFRPPAGGLFCEPIGFSLLTVGRLLQNQTSKNNRTSVDDFGYGGRVLEIVRVVRAAIPCAAGWLSAALLRGQMQENVLVGRAWVWKASSRQRHLDHGRHQNWHRSSVHASSVYRTAVAATGD